jgi:putative intracellular protease/amidase
MTKTVHLAVYDELADWEVGHVVANVNAPIWHEGGYRVVTVAETTDPVTTMGGVRILPAMKLEDLIAQDSELLILPGATTWDTGGNRAFARGARSFLDAGVPVAAICGATLGLADEGLLDGRPHTSSAVEYLQTTNNYRGGDQYRDEPAVTDDDLITAGPTNPVDFARHVFARLGLMTSDVLEAWYGLYSTGDARFFGRLVAARQAETPS